MCRDSENLTAAPKFSGVKWTQIGGGGVTVPAVQDAE